MDVDSGQFVVSCLSNCNKNHIIKFISTKTNCNRICYVLWYCVKIESIKRQKYKRQRQKRELGNVFLSNCAGLVDSKGQSLDDEYMEDNYGAPLNMVRWQFFNFSIFDISQYQEYSSYLPSFQIFAIKIVKSA